MTILAAFACIGIAILPTMSDDAPKPTASVERSATAPATGASIRVGGDLEAKVEKRGEDYLFGKAQRITTPLPVGYPAPTPPGAIEIKHYPSVRRAEYDVSGVGRSSMNGGFWPLFFHIQRRDIEMTSPVEMDLRGVKVDKRPSANEGTMSFLYRTKDLGALGEDGKVRIVDAPELTVVSIGVKGPYGIENLKSQFAALELWLAEHPEWMQAGDPRTLSYNGPEVRDAEKWAELQFPIAPASATPKAEPKTQVPENASKSVDRSI